MGNCLNNFPKCGTLAYTSQRKLTFNGCLALALAMVQAVSQMAAYSLYSAQFFTGSALHREYGAIWGVATETRVSSLASIRQVQGFLLLGNNIGLSPFM